MEFTPLSGEDPMRGFISDAIERERRQSMWQKCWNDGQNMQNAESMAFLISKLQQHEDYIMHDKSHRIYFHLHMIDMQFSHMDGMGQRCCEWLLEEMKLVEQKFGCTHPTKEDMIAFCNAWGEFLQSEFPQRTKNGRTLTVHQAAKALKIAGEPQNWKSEWGPLPEDDEFKKEKFLQHIREGLQPIMKMYKSNYVAMYFLKKAMWKSNDGVFREKSLLQDQIKFMEDNPKLNWPGFVIGRAIQNREEWNDWNGASDAKVLNFQQHLLAVTLPNFLFNMTCYKALLLDHAQQAQQTKAKCLACMMTVGIAAAQLFGNFVFHRYIAGPDDAAEHS